MTSNVTCPRNLPQHFNGCSCTTASRTTAEVEADLMGAITDYGTHGHVHLPGLGDISRGRPGGPTTPVADMERISIHGSDAERGLLAANVNATPEVLDRLSVDRHRGVRAAVAANEYAPPSALLNVANQPGGPTTMETRALVSNANAPTEALEAVALPFDENDWSYPLSATDLANHRRVSETLLVAIRDGSTYDHQARGAATTRLSNRRYDEVYDVTREINDGNLLEWEEDNDVMTEWIRRADQIAATDPAEHPTPAQRREEIAALVRQTIARREP